MKPSPPNRPTPILPLERDADRHAARRAEERVLLADQLAAQLLQIHRQDLAGIRRRKRHLLLAAALVGEHGHEQALTGEQPLAGAEQRAHDAAPLLLAAVAEDGFHLDARRHVHHRAGLGHGALARIELDLDELHLAAEDPEVDLVRAAAGHDRRRRRRGGALPRRRSRNAASCGTSLSGVQFVMPAVNTSVLPSIVPFRRLVTTSSCDTGPTWWPPMAMYHCCCDIVSVLSAARR